jgi:hypothetical protein
MAGYSAAHAIVGEEQCPGRTAIECTGEERSAVDLWNRHYKLYPTQRLHPVQSRHR